VFALTAISIYLAVLATIGLAVALNVRKRTIQLEKMMATQGQGLTDLGTQVSGLGTDLASLATAASNIEAGLQQVETQLANAGSSGDSDAAVEAAAQQLATLRGQLAPITAALNAAAATVPAPPSTPQSGS
jgi:septal ring factor EnvC (AmiA/AmiB activator)